MAVRMPKLLRAACVVYIGSLVSMAVLAPLYESGPARFTTPALILLFVATAAMFMARKRWTWHYMKAMAFTTIAINALFFPAVPFYGEYLLLAKLLVAAEMAASGVIIGSLLWRPETAAWFSAEGARSFELTEIE
jgi:hypothetical protein